MEMKLREAKIQSDLSSRAKSEFLANMSHELRTPLNAIIGFSEIIRDEVLGPIGNVQYKEYVRDIYDSGKKLLSIINEILDVSRIETGDRQLNEGVVDITRITRSCLDFIRPKLMAEKLVVVNLMEGAVPKVIGEELAIKQIILNLLSNAVKFTGEGGRITLSHEIDHEGQLRIAITDTGIGLDETEIEKALSPFGQVDSSLSRGGSGAGLGLTLVDSLIKLHGGRLELFSQKGVGTTATIVFPARRVAQELKEGEGHIDGGDLPDGPRPTRNLQ
jgi:signal transduction histidine kinase